MTTDARAAAGVGDVGGGVTAAELRLAARNHALPLEALRWPITPPGLHYVLVHYDIPAVDPAAWRLEIGGRVTRPRSLSLAQLRALPAVTRAVTLECAGNGRALLEPRPISQPWLTEAVGTAEWTGVPLALLLDEAGLGDDVVELLFSGLDRGVEDGVEQRYERSLSLADALAGDVLLAYAMNGAPLPPQHGFPLRLVVPGWYGMAHVKWLGAITALTEPFGGYQQAVGYRLYASEEELASGDGDGAPVTRIAPRSLTVPPGIPDFLTRERVLDAGRCVLAGRAWSGRAPIERVEVSADGGEHWSEAALDPPLGPHAWRGWSWTWDATPGAWTICSRATDATGETQPLTPVWNVKGYVNNAVERIPVTVRG
ncbi:sulfite oxidase [Conexibacter woesei]|uniref:Sulfite oxidase n=1 Tax=Conexibacter woesei (strain DSM 14684 / CCUG 47730 / CIP 108061 / JCM 11494 / NBRC 100937 / ID131577) TaxID=469383 RepID=D3F8T1_CONWI|nr:sulfite oxidase [Conexibacter woesei]ADB51045.1 Sulfite oxidase [Conexibacter woesei DSM 14684]